MNPARWSTAGPWLVRGALLVVAWLGMSSDSEAVATVARLMLFGLLPSFGQLFRRRKRVVPVLSPGHSRIVLQQASWRDWGKVKRVLHDDLGIDYATGRALFRDLPVTLEPPLVRSRAEAAVARLAKAGAVASVITIDPAAAPEQLSGGPVQQQ